MRLFNDQQNYLADMKPAPQTTCRLARWTAFSAIVLLSFFLFRLFALRSTPQPQKTLPDNPPPEILEPVSDVSTLPVGMVDYIANAEDTLPTLALAFAIDVETLAAANHLSPFSSLSPGQRILIPCPPPPQSDSGSESAVDD